jgi:hypothetical protein
MLWLALGELMLLVRLERGDEGLGIGRSATTPPITSPQSRVCSLEMH